MFLGMDINSPESPVLQRISQGNLCGGMFLLDNNMFCKVIWLWKVFAPLEYILQGFMRTDAATLYPCLKLGLRLQILIFSLLPPPSFKTVTQCSQGCQIF